jgi:superfamily II DNA/RNA helicase
MSGFQNLGLSESLKSSLAKMNFITPTPIQEKSIPLALEGKDILGSAQTGTGKTAAYSIPMIEKLSHSKQHTALILTPTRELAKQVLAVITLLLGKNNSIKAACLIGGESMYKQLGQLKMRPRIIVGTPGRINDHLDRKSLRLSETNFLVLDETDRMLDMGFGIQIDRILKHLPVHKQTLMFSATLPESIIKMSAKYLRNPERVSIGATNVLSANIKQEIIRINQEQKYSELIKQLQARKGSVLIFVKTKHNSRNLAQKLCKENFKADALHGNLRQSKRNTVMQAYRNKKFTILVATDIAARGLDVPHIEHVINYDLPQVAEDYIHRMGRTARAGAEGSTLSFITNSDREKWHAIETLLDPTKKRDNSRHHNQGRSNFNKGNSRKEPSRRRLGRSFDHKKRTHSRNFGERRFEPRKEDRDNKNFRRKEGAEVVKNYKKEGQKDYRRKESQGQYQKDYRRKEFQSQGQKDYRRKPTYN